MTKIGHWSIMANMSDENIGWHSQWVPNGGVGVSVIHIRQFLKGQGWVIFHHGPEPRPTIPSAQNGISMNTSLVVWCHSNWVTIMAAVMTLYRSIVSLGGMPVMTSVWPLSLGSSCHRVCAISTNPGGGNGGLLSVIDWYGIYSWGRVNGTSTSAVACVAVAVGWPSLWVADRDPLGWILLLWVWLFGVLVVQPSFTMSRLFLSIWMALWWWRLPPLQNWWTGPLPARALVHFPPDNEVGWGLGVVPPQPNAAGPLQGQWYGVPGRDGCLGSQTSCPSAT